MFGTYFGKCPNIPAVSFREHSFNLEANEAVLFTYFRRKCSLGVFAYVCQIDSFDGAMGISYLDHLIKCVFVGNE